MNCPRCSVALEWKSRKDIGANCCPACQGIWLDQAALNATRHNRHADLPEVMAGNSDSEPSTIACPQDGTALRTLTHLAVEIDVCPTCKGLWLDKGEWEKLVEARSAGVSKAGIAAAALGGGALLGGVASLAQGFESNESYVTRNRGSSPADAVGDVVTDMVGEAAGGLLDGALSLIGEICCSIFD